MAANYLEMLARIQDQTLENLKTVQSAQLATLGTARDLVAQMPQPGSIPTVPTIDGMPTFAQIAELNTSFATQVIDAQKAFANQLAELFAPAVKAGSN